MRPIKLSNKNPGFTLLEIIVSIAVIGILLSISVVSYGNWKQKTTIAQAKSDLLSISTAFENYKNTNNSFPSDISKIANFKASSGITITGGSRNGNFFCVNASSTNDSSVKYHITSVKKEVQNGICPEYSWKTVSVGYYHTCAINYDDIAYCWGKNASGQLGNGSLTDSLTPVAVSQGEMPSLLVKSIVSNNWHTCVIAHNDQVYCWGNSYNGELGNGLKIAQQTTPKAISQGEMSTLSVKQISGGQSHTCVIAFNDQAYCWGGNTEGQLGDNTTTQRSSPVSVNQGYMTTPNVKKISSRRDHTCAINYDDRAYCWGDNYWGQLGNNSNVDSSLPVAVQPGTMPSSTIKTLSAGAGFSCAVSINDNAYCWGINYSYQLGNGTSSLGYTPTTVLKGDRPDLIAKNIIAGNSHACVISNDDYLYCWGFGYEGGLGDKQTKAISYPVATVKGQRPSLNVSKFDANSSSCIINDLGDLYCFGDNDYGQLGLDYKDQYSEPMQIEQGAMPFTTLKEYSVGSTHACGLLYNAAYCWGSNGDYELGNIAPNKTSNPLAIQQGAMPSLQIKSINAGTRYSCAISITDKAYCWGFDYNGQLGDGTTVTQRTTPVAVLQGAMPSQTVKSIELSKNGGSSTCAIGSDNKAYCWGSNASGELGDGTTAQKTTPVAVSQGAMPSQTVKSMSVGAYFACAIASDDKGYCWGRNTSGQLGNGSNVDSSTPVAVSQGAMPSQTIKSISAGYMTTCAISSDNKAYCWGSNGFDSLGTGTSDINTPAAVAQGAMSTQSVKFISTGSYHTCTINTDNKAYCWGRNDYGNLGNNSTNTSKTPVLAKKIDTSTPGFTSISAGKFITCALSNENKLFCWGDNSQGQLGIIHRSVFSHNTPQFVLPKF